MASSILLFELLSILGEDSARLKGDILAGIKTSPTFLLPNTHAVKEDRTLWITAVCDIKANIVGMYSRPVVIHGDGKLSVSRSAMAGGVRVGF